MRTLMTGALLGCFLLSSCVSLRLGADDRFLEMKGLLNVHGSIDGLNSWDGETLLDFGLFTNTQGRAEIVSLELGPLAGVGVGIVGARARVLPLEIGVGTLFYNPRRTKAEMSVEVETYEGEAEEGHEGEHEKGHPEGEEGGNPEGVGSKTGDPHAFR